MSKLYMVPALVIVEAIDKEHAGRIVDKALKTMMLTAGVQEAIEV